MPRLKAIEHSSISSIYLMSIFSALQSSCQRCLNYRGIIFIERLKSINSIVRLTSIAWDKAFRTRARFNTIGICVSRIERLPARWPMLINVERCTNGLAQVPIYRLHIPWNFHQAIRLTRNTPLSSLFVDRNEKFNLCRYKGFAPIKYLQDIPQEIIAAFFRPLSICIVFFAVCCHNAWSHIAGVLRLWFFQWAGCFYSKHMPWLLAWKSSFVECCAWSRVDGTSVNWISFVHRKYACHDNGMELLRSIGSALVLERMHWYFSAEIRLTAVVWNCGFGIEANLICAHISSTRPRSTPTIYKNWTEIRGRKDENHKHIV